jgi:myo-inositol-1(or 4)-monophosphatase
MMESYLKAFGHLMRVSHGLRRLGSAAVDLAYVACGRFDGFYEYGLNLWDVAAGQLIVKQAGGEISDFKGGKNYLLGKEMVATNKLIHRELVNIIKDYFND